MRLLFCGSGWLPIVDHIAARLTDDHPAIPILHEAVTSVAEDQARLQTVAGRHVHVAYFDTVLAAADVFDDRAWADLTHAGVQLARRAGALAALPLALGFRSEPASAFADLGPSSSASLH